MKESDGVKEPILPQIRFETLENLEEVSVSITKMSGFCWHEAQRMPQITKLTMNLKEVYIKNAILRIM